MVPNPRSLLGLAAAVGCCLAVCQLSAPGRAAGAFSLTGHSLGVGSRGFRVLNSFTDASANDNTVEHPSFPGSTGAVLALRKAHAEWGSAPRQVHGHGDGLADNPVLGGSGANFDQIFLGEAAALGGLDSNMHHALAGGLCGGSTLAFTQIVGGVGWRIAYCDGWAWSDGPGAPEPGSIDLQAVATREIGFALGLGTSSVPGASMSPVALGGGSGARSLEADDLAGLAAIYGAAAATKPLIVGVTGEGEVGRLLEITGERFHATDNEVWFTPADGADQPVVVAGLPSSRGGTRLTVGVPAGVASGDLLVKVPGSSGASLSNAWAFAAGRPQEALLTLATGLGGSSGEVPQLTAAGDLTPGSSEGFAVDVQLAGAGLPGLLFLGAGIGGVPFKGGVFEPLPLLAQLGVVTDGQGRLSWQTAFDGSVPSGAVVVAQVWFADASGPAGATGTNGLVLTVP